MLTRTRATFALNTESTYDWQRNQCIVPINSPVAQLLKIDVQVVQLGVGAR
jgi:hypothetical protein